VLLSLLLLPLYIPVLIFATSAIDAASMGLPMPVSSPSWGPCWWGH
jgi:heme exporter protein CcmB